MKGIYRITCKITNRVYVGQTSLDFFKRWQAHVHDLTNGTHSNEELQKEWSTYGPTAYTFEIVEVYTQGTNLFKAETAEMKRVPTSLLYNHRIPTGTPDCKLAMRNAKTAAVHGLLRDAIILDDCNISDISPNHS